MANSQSRKEEAGKLYEEATKIAEEIFGESDKRTLEYKHRAEEISASIPPKKKDKPLVSNKGESAASSSDTGSKITRDSILATTYGTFNGVRMKLIIVDYIKGKSLKVYGMKKDSTFAKSLCLPYTVFQIYFQVEGKVIGPQDIKNESAIDW